MSKVRTVLSLSRTDRRLLMEAARALLAAWAMLHLRPFRAVAATLDRSTPRPDAVPVDIRKLRWAVECAARNLPLTLTCLPQAFAASWMLARRGSKPLMHYGVAKTDADGFESHAWVEQDGQPVIGHRVANRFTRLSTFPPQAAA